MEYMFEHCSSLISLNLSKFDTSNSTMMPHMFFGCSLLTSLNLSNFDTSNVKEMQYMFSRCSSLTSLDLSNFDISKVEYMHNMFYGCSSLISLNLSNFNTSNTKGLENMFKDCSNLEYINMINFNENSLNNGQYSEMFKNVPDNIVFCINKNNILNKIYPYINSINCHIEDCTDDWKLKQNKSIYGTNECINNCSEINRYEYNGKCYQECQKGYFYDNNIIKCKCGLEKCLTCPPVALNKELCTKCNDNYYPMENDPLNIGDYFNCYNETPRGYYLDKNDSLYKKCYYTCEICEIKGDNYFHNCLKCNIEFNFGIKTNNYTNCYEKCNYNYYFDNNSNYYCTEDLSCPTQYSKLYENTNECVIEDIKYIENIIDYILNYEKNQSNEENGKEQEINNYNKILEKIESIFTSDNYDLTNIDNGVDQIINANRMIITLTNYENQKNNIETNMSTIDLGNCEKLLRNYYNLTNNQTIYIKKIDVIQERMKAKKVEYNIYSKISGKNLEKLNLSVCENTKITINIPIEIFGNIDKLNTSSGYYNDICYVTTSDDGTDISLQDRKNEYINSNNNIICQEDCDFTAYNSELKKAKCECYTKESNLSFVDMVINKTKLFENLKNIKNLINLNILICYKKLLSFTSYIHNVGSLIIISILIFHIISIFVFYINQLNKIKKSIRDISIGISNICLIKEFQIKTNKIKLSKRKKSKKRNNKIIKDTQLEGMKRKIKRKKKKKLKFNNNIFLNTNTNIRITTNISENNIINNTGFFTDNTKKEIKKINEL